MTRLLIVLALVVPLSLFVAWAVGWLYSTPILIPYGLLTGYFVHAVHFPSRWSREHR